MPFIHPYTDKQRPIDAGLKSSPPNSMDVDQMRGMSAADTIPRRARLE
jgi:hypothetical protein